MGQKNCTLSLGLWLIGNENGSVYYCEKTQVVSLGLQDVILRFEAAAFRDLLGMMGFAQAEIEQIRNALDHPFSQRSNQRCTNDLLH